MTRSATCAFLLLAAASLNAQVPALDPPGLA